VLLARLALHPLVLIMDGSVVGRGCVALMLHVVYKGRALPVAWQVRKGKKGHFPEDLHIALVKQVQPLIPPGASVVLLGDGEFDGPTLQHTLQDAHWSYVVRTGSNVTVQWDGERFRCETVAACIKPGTLVALTDVHVTAAAYGPVMLLCCWAKGYHEPLHLLTNLASADEACRLYAKRFRIETFFSDQKSRGFHLHKSHLAEPLRLSRLLIAACLAYIWIIYLGALCAQDGWVSVIHRSDRCDLSLFQLGLRLLEHLLNEDRAIPVAFCVSET
jgi:hypothetical protein